MEILPKIIEYSEPLYRVDKGIVPLGINLMSNLFTEDRPTYFLTNSKNSNSYAKHYQRKFTNTDIYLRTFQPSAPLNLIDLGDPQSIQWLRTQVSPDALAAINTSFQIRANGSAYRRSNAETKIMDDISLRAICNLGGFDGYYVNAPGLHSEIGLCFSAFPKINFISQKIINTKSINRAIGKKMSRANYLRTTKNNSKNNSNNNANNNANGLTGPPTIKRIKWGGGTRKNKRRS